jgi:hypothetical protein
MTCFRDLPRARALTDISQSADTAVLFEPPASRAPATILRSCPPAGDGAVGVRTRRFSACAGSVHDALARPLVHRDTVLYEHPINPAG